MRMVSLGSDLPGVFAIGQQAKGVIAIGQEATGVIAIGQLATGVVAVGQLARGVIVVGQLALGLAAVGQIGFGVLWYAGLGIGGTAGPGAVFGCFGRLRFRQQSRRLAGWLRREPWDTVTRARRPAWRLALGAALLSGMAAAWWILAGQTIVAILS